MPLSPFFAIPDSVRFWNIWSRETEVFAKAYTVATLPDASENRGLIVLVTNETGGAVLAFSDGTDFRRCTDRAIVS